MKKTYMIPATLITRVNVERMVAASPELSDDSANQSYGMDVKEDRGSRGSRSDYNVWNDDWSQ